tara:strand:- start:431 stop:1789 length:1359 start_codon:yes stop_codon:yes gene_type:complete
MVFDEVTRRDILGKIGFAAGISTLGMGLGQLSIAAEAYGGGAAGSLAAIDQPWWEMGMMEDEILEQVLIFYMGHTWQQLSDVGECLDTASRVKRGEPWSWANEWDATAKRLQALAEESESQGHTISAGEAYLRASNYYIASMHRHPDPYHESIERMTRASVSCFSKGIKHLGLPVEEVEIPYEGTTLPGYFFRSPVADTKAPTMIIFNGRDAWSIQDKVLAEAGNKRGYHVMLFDGPGQGQVMRLQGLPFRHDWEKVITPVVDYTLTMEGVDPERIGVMGLSMGGVLAPRAAAFEHRPKVYVANPGVVSWLDVVNVTIAPLVGGEEGLKLIDSDPAAFDKIMNDLIAQSSFLQWGMDDTYWKQGVKTPVELMLELRKYDNTDVAANIRSKMLLMHGEADLWGQVDELKKMSGGPTDIVRFGGDYAGQLHCQTGAWSILNHKLYNWLDENLKV